MFVPISNGKALWRVLCASAVLCVGSVALFRPAPARADTPTQVQKAIQAVCDRACAATARRDLTAFMAMYSTDYVLSNVAGRKTNFRQLQAGIASNVARDDYHVVTRCTVSQVMAQGDQVRAVLRWHYIDHHLPSSSSLAYTYMRDYEEQSVWKKSFSGWHEVRGQVTHDVMDYRR